MIVHVLFDSGATRSFISLMLRKKFSNAPWTLDYPLEVEIANDCSVGDKRVHQGCVLNMFNERYSVELVPIPLRGLKVIVGMEWFGSNGAMIEC